MKKRIALVLALVFILAFALSACNNQTPATSDPTKSPATGDPTKSPEDENRKAGGDGILRFGESDIKGVFSPFLYSDVYDGYVVDMIFAGMFERDPQTGSVVYGDSSIATGCTLSNDNKTYTFKLKEGVKFSDGTPLTSADVQFTFELVAHPKYDGPRMEVTADLVGAKDFTDGKTDHIAGIVCEDDLTISFTVEEANSTKLDDFGYGIMSKDYYKFETWDEFKDFNHKPMGAGPLKLKEYTPGQRVLLELNEYYFGPKYYIDGVSIEIVSNDTKVQALTGKKIDLVQPSSNMDNYELLNNTDGVSCIAYQALTYNGVFLNLLSEKLSDVKVRQALMYGWNRKETTYAEYKDLAVPCLTPFSPLMWAYPDESKLNSYEFDPEKAKTILEDAGWVDSDGDGVREKNGTKLSLVVYIYPDAAWPGNLVSALTEQWADIGVELTSIQAEFTTVMSDVDKRLFDKFDMWTQGWSMSIDPDVSAIYGREAIAMGGYNRMSYDSEELNNLLAEGKKTFDQAERARIYQRCAEILNEDLPALFNVNSKYIWGVSDKVTGLDQMGPFYNWVSCLKDVRIAK